MVFVIQAKASLQCTNSLRGCFENCQLTLFIMRLMYLYIYTYNIKGHTILQSYTHILCYVYYIHILQIDIVSLSLSRIVCHLHVHFCIYIDTQHTIQYLYIYIHMQIFLKFLYEHINLICTHVYIHNYIYISIHLSIFSFFFGGPAWTVKLPLHWTPGRAAIWALSWIWLIKKVSCWDKLAGQQLGGGWLGRCGNRFFGHGFFFFGVYF